MCKDPNDSVARQPSLSTQATDDRHDARRRLYEPRRRQHEPDLQRNPRGEATELRERRVQHGQEARVGHAAGVLVERFDAVKSGFG